MTSPASAVTVAGNIADALVELAWATRPGQPLSQADRYAVTTALAAAVAVLPQVLTQIRTQIRAEAPGHTRSTLQDATATAYDLAGLLDAAAQHLA